MQWIKRGQCFLLCDFIMNPLVCQSDDRPPTKEIHTSVCTFYQQKHCSRRQGAHQSMSLVSLVNIHASSNSIIAA